MLQLSICPKVCNTNCLDHSDITEEGWWGNLSYLFTPTNTCFRVYITSFVTMITFIDSREGKIWLTKLFLHVGLHWIWSRWCHSRHGWDAWEEAVGQTLGESALKLKINDCGLNQTSHWSEHSWKPGTQTFNLYSVPARSVIFLKADNEHTKLNSKMVAEVVVALLAVVMSPQCL